LTFPRLSVRKPTEEGKRKKLKGKSEDRRFFCHFTFAFFFPFEKLFFRLPNFYLLPFAFCLLWCSMSRIPFAGFPLRVKILRFSP
jgi:hypothetical protein